jgi:hypothetical protein
MECARPPAVREEGTVTKGRCLCGALTYELERPFSAMIHCHCSMCRKHQGAGFATFVVGPLAGFRWISGEGRLGRYQSSPSGVRTFCRVCGSAGPTTMPELGIAVAPAASFEGELGIKPQSHIFVGSKAAWDAITDDLPAFDAYPPEFGAQGVARPVVTPRAGITEGSCLCGEIGYEITGAPVRMMNCHCSRCRLGRAAAHATNVFFKLDQFRWVRGATLVTEYKVPDARFHAVAFCSRCGGKVPRPSPERGVVVVPAGSLDTDPSTRAQAHIFVADKAPWFDITGPLPQYPGMPPG